MVTAHAEQGVRYSTRRLIENKASGEKLEIITTAAETGGAYMEAIVTVPAGFKPLALHAHPRQSEEFKVLSGTLGIKNNGETHILDEGESILSTAGSSHTWWNAGDDELRFLAKITPSLNFVDFLGVIYDSANARSNAEPSLVDAIYILTRYRDEYDPVFLPKPVRMLLFPPLYALGKFTGRHRVVDAWIAAHYA